MMIVTTPFFRKLYGFGGPFQPNNVWPSGRLLMDRMWAQIRSQTLPNKGLNHWVYDGLSLFVGVELLNAPASTQLESLVVQLPQYAYAKHIGSYGRLDAVYQDLQAGIRRRGLRPTGRSLEIYGHDNGPDAPIEIEILIGVEETRSR